MDTENTSEMKKPSRRASSRLRQEREQRGWSQSDIAERIGTTQINVSRWENSLTFPGPYYRQKLAEIYGKSIQELGLVPEMNNEQDENISPPVSNSDTAMAITVLPVWNVPFRRNPFFTGRDEILAHLYAELRSNRAAALTQAQAISGLGGIGKTQIAIEFAYRYRDHYQAICWVNATAHDTITADFVALASQLGLSTQAEQDIVVRSVKQWLIAHVGWLLILDNVDDLDMVADFLPTPGNGDVLITTRLQALGSVAQSIEVEKMEMEEGITLLLRRAKVIPPAATQEQASEESKQQARLIFTELDGLPLALDQAGAFIEETRCGLAQYLSLYGTNRKELLLRRGKSPINHPQPVASTWSLSFQQVEQGSPAAADLLRLCAFLGAEAIPEEIITQGTAEAGPVLETVAGNPLEVNAIIGLLLRYSLIRRNPEEQLLSVHRLVQAILRDDMNEDTQRIWAERAIRTLNRAFPDVDLKTWDACQRLLPHVQACAAYPEQYHLAFPKAGRLFHEAASYLVARGNYKQAQYLLLRALEIRQQTVEARNSDIACTLNDLGEVYRKQSNYQNAENLLHEALAMRQQMLGNSHPDVAQTLYYLANIYRTQGAYAKAEPLLLQALHIRESVPTIDPALVAQSYYGLAKLYNSQEKYHEAEKLCQLALNFQEQSSDSNHQTMIASILVILGKAYKGQKKFEEAKGANLRAMSIRKETLGKEHPQVATTINNLVEIYHAEGKYQKAEPLIEEAIKIHEQSLGSNHPYMAYSYSNKAVNCALRGDYAQAESYYEKALAIREKALAPDHPIVVETRERLAKLRREVHNS